MSIPIMLCGLAVLIAGIAWLIQRTKYNGLMFLVPFFMLITEFRLSYWWTVALSSLSLLAAISSFLLIIKKL
jgi:hypothetical protein